MGLDVYLYKIKDAEKCAEWRAEYEKVEEDIDNLWKEKLQGRKYEQLSDEEKDEVREQRDALLTERGFPTERYYDNPHTEEINLDSQEFPDHMFKVGYFRSSYNPGGINHIMEDRIGKTLYTLFAFEDADDGRFYPDWKAAKERTQDAFLELAAAIDITSSCGVEIIRPNMFKASEIQDAHQALAVFMEQLKQYKAGRPTFGSYSNVNGHFWLDEPLKVRAAVQGKQNVYVIYETGEDGFDWYLNALKIVIETCDHVLAQDDPESYYMIWSY